MSQERVRKAKYLNTFQMDAIVLNRPKIANVAKAYREGRLALDDAERMASLLASRNKQARERGNQSYQHFMDKGQEGLMDKLKPKREREQIVSMRVILFTHKDKRDKGHIADDDQYRRYQKYLKGKYKEKYSTFWVGDLHVQGTTRKFLGKLLDMLVVRGRSKEWRDLYRICMTDPDFKNRELMAPGYVEAMMVIRVDKDLQGPLTDPADAAMTAAGEHVTINYRYCSNTMDMSKDTFAEAIKNKRYVTHECWINALYDCYGKKLLDPSKNQRYRITREDILNILGRTEENIKEGLTIQQVVPFFEKFKLKLRVRDIFHNLVFKYDPPIDSMNNPTMFCMCHERHIYTLSDNLESLAQRKGNEEEEETVVVRVGTDYKVKEQEGRKHCMIDNVDDILHLLKALPENGEPNQDTIWMIQKEDDLEKILMQMRDAGHTPQVKLQRNGRLSMILDAWNKQTFIIKTQQLNPTEIDGIVFTNKAEIYDKIDEVFADMKNKVLRMEHKSYYSPADMVILDTCRTTANVGLLGHQALHKLNLVELDMTKAYTWAFSQITKIPIFNEFDVWRPFVPNASPIKPLNLYLVKNNSFSLVGNKEHTLTYGKFLPAGSQIMAVKEPSFIKKVSYKQIAQELMNTEISTNAADNKHFQKQIANTIYGLLEMHINKNSKSFIFDTYNDCKFYQAKYGGLIHQIKQYEERRYDYINPLDEGIEGIEAETKVEFVETDKTLYVLNIYAQADMTNGFRYIKELLMQTFNHRVQESYDKLKEAGVQVYSVKTDAFTINKKDLKVAQHILNIKMENDHKEIGDWRVSKDGASDDIKLPYEKLSMVRNAVPEIREPVFNEIPLTLLEEYDVDKLCSIFEEKKRVMVRARFPGSGKSFACKHMVNRGHNVLFVCPTNKLACSYKERGITINKFFGVGLTEETRLSRFDHTPYDTIVFDEIFFSNIKNLTRIKRFCDQHPEKIIIATGDTDQLECIDLITNQKDYDEYCNFCINSIFPFGIELQENKRLKSKKDREKLKKIKKDIFDSKLSVKEIIEKYFKFVDKLTTNFNIAYKNVTCKDVSEKVRRMLRKKQEYEEGEVLVCRKYTKLGKSKIVFNVNYEYTITEVREATLCLDGEFWLPLPLVRTAFVHNYCRTCHSFQGSSIDDAITIFDWGNFFVSRKWMWTAITRARSLDKVYFWKYDEKPENMKKLMEYLELKVGRYKIQDLKAKREIVPENYITAEWLRNCLGTCCQNCGDVLNFDIVDKKIQSNLSAQRLDNSIAHERDNCVPWCSMCNCIVSNRD